MNKNIRLLLLIFIFTPSIPSWSQNLSAVRSPEGIEISEDSEKILFYQIRPKSMDGQYQRANYIHPLYSLNGHILTEDFPADHPHHHGIFWSWHQILYNDRSIGDSWTSDDISWEVVDVETIKRKRSITLNADVLWKSAITGDGEEDIIREQTKIIVHAAGNNYRVIDFDIHLAALKDNLKIGGSDDPKGYGGFSFRLKLPQDIRFVNKTEEIEAQELAVNAGPWLDLVGSFEGNGKRSGVAVFSHPSNPGHPQQWILRSKNSMQNVAFPGRTPVELSRQGMHLRYRMIVHEQDLSLEDLEVLYREYSQR